MGTMPKGVGSLNEIPRTPVTSPPVAMAELPMPMQAVSVTTSSVRHIHPKPLAAAEGRFVFCIISFRSFITFFITYIL